MTLKQVFTSISVFSFLLLGCGNNARIAGTVTDTGNPVITGRIVDTLGHSVSGVQAFAIPVSYDPVGDRGVPDSMMDTTDQNGRFAVRIPVHGTYNVQALHLMLRTRILIQNVDAAGDSTALPADTLRNSARIEVVVPLGLDSTNGYFFIPGTTVYALLSHTAEGRVVLDSVPALANLSIYYSVRGSSAVRPVRDSVIVAPGGIVTIAYVGWAHSQKLVLNTTASGAGVAGAVTGFPVLVRLTGANFNFAEAQAGGADVRVAKSDGTPLSYEIERWDASSQTAEIWVKVDTVFGNNSSQFFMMYWGNSNAASESNGAAVFDTANGFQGVWHLNEADGAPVKDATANHYDGGPSTTAPASVPGMVGPAQKFDGAATFLTMSGTATGKLDFQEYGTYTVSAWVLTDTLKSGNDSLRQYIVSKGNPEYTLQMNITKGWDFGEFVDATKWNYVTSTGAAHVWSYAVGVRSGTSMYLYVDGILADTTVKFSAVGIARNSTDLVIGRHAGNVNSSYFDGVIDEVRISSVSCSADWIKLCYMNQKANDALIVLK